MLHLLKEQLTQVDWHCHEPLRAKPRLWLLPLEPHPAVHTLSMGRPSSPLAAFSWESLFWWPGGTGGGGSGRGSLKLSDLHFRGHKTLVSLSK